MKVLVACERSGVVRDAFLKKGHDAWSCDLVDSETPGPHITGDVLKVLDEGWDMMIAHPPCTYLCNSGVRWLFDNPERMEKMVEARNFFLKICDADIGKICIENPIPHHYLFADILVPRYDQIVQPWQFGHPEQKSTCLWLKGLPKLHPTSTSLECENNRTYAKMMKLPKRERADPFYESRKEPAGRTKPDISRNRGSNGGAMGITKMAEALTTDYMRELAGGTARAGTGSKGRGR